VQRSVTGSVAALELVAKAVISASRAPFRKWSGRHPGEQPEDQRQHDEAVEQRGAGDDDDEMAQAVNSPPCWLATSCRSSAARPSGARRMIQPTIIRQSSCNS
jgi:hypothetical protein